MTLFRVLVIDLYARAADGHRCYTCAQPDIQSLFSKQLQGQVSHLAVPKQRPMTYLITSLKADTELLSGPLNVYFGGRFVGKTLLAEKKAGDALRLNLGIDREVLVKREKTRDQIKETIRSYLRRGS